MQLKNKKRKGFTLVELIVVIAILLVLAVLASVAYGNLTQQAQRAALRSDATALARAINMYNSLCSSDDDKITPQTAAGVTNGWDHFLAGIGSANGTLGSGFLPLSVAPGGLVDAAGTADAPVAGPIDFEGSIALDATQANWIYYGAAGSAGGQVGVDWLYWNDANNRWEMQEGALPGSALPAASAGP